MMDKTPSRQKRRTRTIRDQREANQKLILTALRAHEAVEEAEVGRSNAEVREQELLRTAEFREELLAIVGHDLRSPLQASSMAAQLLIRQGNLNALDTKLAVRIIDSGRRMDRMISQILEFTRARLGGGLLLDLKPTDLRPVCRQVVEELEMGTAVPLRCELEGDLVGIWDEDRLAQVLSNLFGNAIQHAVVGSSVTVTACLSGGDVIVQVINQGTQIPPELLPILFKPFRRAEERSPSHRGGHLGLGLYIAEQIALAHGGSISARCSDGTTTFTVRLPRHPSPNGTSQSTVLAGRIGPNHPARHSSAGVAN